MSHPSILCTREAFDGADTIDLIIERADGGELFDMIVERQGFTEDDARHVVRQIVEGIAYLHRQGIAHRDLKAENILVANTESLTVKIGEFGLSNVLGQSAQLVTACGTPDYVAPEVLKGVGYNQAVDLWAAGVLTYIILVGYAPFYADDGNQATLFRKIMNVEFDFGEEEWESVSPAAKDFISKLLVEDPVLRYSANQALKHAWLATASTDASNKRELRALPSVARLPAYHRRRKKARAKGAKEARKNLEEEEAARAARRKKRRAERKARRDAEDAERALRKSQRKRDKERRRRERDKRSDSDKLSNSGSKRSRRSGRERSTRDRKKGERRRADSTPRK